MPPMAGMDDHAMSDASTIIAVTQTCSHHLCAQQLAFLERGDHVLAHAVPLFESVAVPATAMNPVVSSGWLIARDSPHIRSSSPALNSILRV